MPTTVNVLCSQKYNDKAEKDKARYATEMKKCAGGRVSDFCLMVFVAHRLSQLVRLHRKFKLQCPHRMLSAGIVSL